MLGPARFSPVEPDECLARFILSSSYIRKSDQTVKPDAFIPHPYSDLSVTRHRDTTDAELWECGHTVARQIGKTLHGRADIIAEKCVSQKLSVHADPLPENPNHANITGWPADKAAQKMIALELSVAATLVTLR